MPEETKQVDTVNKTEPTTVVTVDPAFKSAEETVQLTVTESNNAETNQQETIVLEDWQQRMLDEMSELEDRIIKANGYLLTLDRDSIDYRELQNQVQAMREYRQALGKRIARLVPQQ